MSEDASFRPSASGFHCVEGPTRDVLKVKDYCVLYATPRTVPSNSAEQETLDQVMEGESFGGGKGKAMALALVAPSQARRVKPITVCG